jgi:hypothetical protein
MWKKMGEGKEAWINKVGLVTFLDIEWKEPDRGAIMEFFNTFVIKGYEIYFGKRNIMYVINKQILVDAFGICQTR